LNPIYKILQYLSLDVVVGSIGSSILAVKVLDVRLPLIYWLILPICVWIIYTSDHLLDALKLKELAGKGRHNFHFIHRKTISVFLGFAVIISLILVFQQFDRLMIIFGFILGIGIAFYLLANYYISRIFKYFPREFLIAAGYIAGTWGIPILWKLPVINTSQEFIIYSYFLVILSIPLVYSIYEYKSDILNSFISFATTFGIKTTEVTIAMVLILSLLFSLVSFLLERQCYSFLMAFMILILLVVKIFRNRLSRNENYRTIADSLNFLPFILLL